MSVKFECGDGVALVGYVYDDCAPQDASAIAAHVATCVHCADEVKALQSTREGLRAWAPPDVAPGFRVIGAVPAPQAGVVGPARWWRQPLPAWAQVAAAVVLFGAGVGLGALRAADRAPVTASVAAPALSSPAVTPVSARDLTALEERLRADMSRRDRMVEAPVSPRQGDEALLQQVRALIRESERRQQQELALRTAELVKDVDAQRRGDLARIERTFGQMEGTTGVQVEQQRQLLNYLMRVSQRQPQQ